MGTDQQPNAEILPLNTIRVETVLSRYPVHRLGRKGSIKIDLTEQNRPREAALQWKVSYNSEYGQPGPLAYKVDTLIINRRLEEATRPVPRIIRLGTLHGICRELGISEGKNVVSIKKALYQNASAFITARIHYRHADGTEKTLEAGFTRYSVVLTGEKLPDNRKADAVYIVLNDVFIQVINGALTRPLDYEYLKSLPPAPQRFYELLSFQIYAALKYDLPRARLTYSEFCAHAPQTRHYDWDKVRSQMNKIHRPHKHAGYIQQIEFQQTTDSAGKPDWIMLYQPGPKARAEFRTFTKRGGPTVLEIEPLEQATLPFSELSEAEQELVQRGITTIVARELVRDYSEERIRAQIERLDWLMEKKPNKVEDPAAYLVGAIKNDYASPRGFVSKAERERRADAKRLKEQQAVEERLKQRDEEKRVQQSQEQARRYFSALPRVEQERFQQAALEAGGEEARQAYRTLSKFHGRGAGYLERLAIDYILAQPDLEKHLRAN